VSIHEKGIAPNVDVVMTAEEDSKLRVQRTREDIADPKDFKERFGFAPIEDRQLKAALDVLKGLKLLDERREAAALR
jgi:carboxyl-terminal processing protease